VNYDNSLVVTITETCYSWAPSNGDHLFACGAIYRPPHCLLQYCLCIAIWTFFVFHGASWFLFSLKSYSQN